MIDDEITYDEKGYRSTDLKPNSHKEVWAVCEGENCERVGGRGRWVRLQSYRALCHLCACRTEDNRIKISDARKGKYGGENSSMYGKHHSDESKKLMSDAKIGKSASNDARKNMRDAKLGKSLSDAHRKNISKHRKGICCGEKNHNWNGGSSFEPYCEKFNEDFKEGVRDKFERVCFICSATEKENMRKLSVHHVSYDKECMCNEVECEFVPLCMKCHNMTNHGRELWERIIINVLWYEGWV